MRYAEQRQWSDKFIPQIRQIVGPHLLEPTSFEVDTQQAADLIVLNARDMRIAARVRKHGYAEKYPFDFTVRSKVASGQRTELAKLIDGFGDWMFYGHADRADELIERWWLIDLHKWRASLIRLGYNNPLNVRMKEVPNGDGSYFVPFDLRQFRPSILVSASHELPELVEAA